MQDDLDQIKLITVGEVARLLRISPSTVRSWTRGGKSKSPVKYLKIGKRTLFHLEDVLAYINQATKG